MAEHGLIVVGSSHRTAPLDLLQVLSLAPDEIAARLPAMARALELEEAVLLSTCNRTEIYAVAARPSEQAARLRDWLLALAAEQRPLAPEHLYLRRDREAADHAFRITCGLDSMMLGETEITGQVQTALDLAREVGTARGVLTRLLSAAFHACKRARNETRIGDGTTSVASAAVHLARRVLGDLDRREVLVVGAGETGALVARYLRHHGARGIHIANRTLARAEQLAEEVGGEALPLDGRGPLLARVDAVVCATHSPAPLITREAVAAAADARDGRTLLIIDISLPRNVEDSVGDLENVYLHDMNDLTSIVESNLARRAKEIPKVERIINEELGNYFSGRAAIAAGPVIKELRQRYEELRRQEIDRFRHKFSADDLPVAERLTHDLVNKLLHHPTLTLRALGGREGDQIELVRQLFGLEEAGSADPEAK